MKKMTTMKTPMWKGGEKKLLADVLAELAIPLDTTWTIRNFEGVIRKNASSASLRIAGAVGHSGMSVTLSTGELNDFASELEDLNEIELIGVYSQGEILISALDSNQWDIRQN